MKRIIDGLVYDTEKAHRIAVAESDAYRTDFRWWEEELYRTPAGRWFIAGAGNAMSRWAQPAGGNCSGPGCGIEPMTEDEALAWCEQHGIDAAVVAAHFTVADA